MRRLIVSVLWALGLGWVVVWGVTAMVRDTMPPGVVWAFLSMVVWWALGRDTQEDRASDN